MATASGPPPPSLSVLLVNLGRRARAVVERELAGLTESGLAFHHFAALGHLSRSPGLSYSELARRTGVSAQSMQTTVGHLVTEGLVERGADDGQGRRAELHLTDAGRQVLRAADRAVRGVDDTLAAGWTADQRTVLETALLQLFLSPWGRED